VGFNYREGLVLHQLAYDDGGVARPVMHRCGWLLARTWARVFACVLACWCRASVRLYGAWQR
jgi:hypothetical protein